MPTRPRGVRAPALRHRNDFAFRVGRRFEFNQLCCGVHRRHNLAISIRDALGLLRFPSQIGQDEQPKKTEIEKLLNSRGYVRVRTWYQDDFYTPRAQAR